MTSSHISKSGAARKEEGAGAGSIAWRSDTCDRRARERAVAEVRAAIDRSGRGLIVESDGRVLGPDFAPTGFRIEPEAGGLMVYVTDVYGVRHWFGSPPGVAPVLRWLLFRSRRQGAGRWANLAARVATK